MEPKKWQDLQDVMRAIYANANLTLPKRVLDEGGSRIGPISPKQAALGDLCGRRLALVPGGIVRVGGGGVVIQCCEANMNEVQYALKVPRPSLFQDLNAAKIEFGKAEAETLTHLPLAHENIAKNHGYGRITFGSPPNILGKL